MCFISFSQTQVFFSLGADPFYKILECSSLGSRVQHSLYLVLLSFLGYYRGVEGSVSIGAIIWMVLLGGVGLY